MAKTSDYIGIPHGEDVFLIFNNELRDIPYSKDEIAVIDNLIGLYYNFASSNLPIYGDIEIEKSEPNEIKALEIFSDTYYVMDVKGTAFGNVKFWDEIEEELHKSRQLKDEL